MLQINLEDLGIIRFVSTPRGGAPETIRKAWVGVEVPCLFSHDGVPLAGEGNRDVVTGMQVPDYPGYIVLQTLALDALRKQSPEAATYWNRQGFPQGPASLFLFDLDSAEIVKPVMTRPEFWRHYHDA